MSDTRSPAPRELPPSWRKLPPGRRDDDRPERLEEWDGEDDEAGEPDDD